MKQISFSIHIFTLFQYVRHTVLALNQNIMNMTFFCTQLQSVNANFSTTFQKLYIGIIPVLQLSVECCSQDRVEK